MTAAPGAPDLQPEGTCSPATPMLWAGANAQGEAVFGVAASVTAAGQVEIVARTGNPTGSCRTLRRNLSPGESRQLARHLVAAADEAERRESLQLVATA